MSEKLPFRYNHMVRLCNYLIANVILLQKFIKLLSNVFAAVTAIKLRE